MERLKNEDVLKMYFFYKDSEKNSYFRLAWAIKKHFSTIIVKSCKEVAPKNSIRIQLRRRQWLRIIKLK